MSLSTIFANFLGQQPKRGFIQPADRFGPFAIGHGPVSLQLDALISESPEYTGTPTQIPVEDGSTISDHVTLRPLKLSIQGIVTDTPVSLVREFSSPFAKPSPSAQAFDLLTKLFNDRIPFDFVGGLTVYRSMVISSFSPTNTSTTGDALRFSCTMDQIRIVSTDPIVVSSGSAASPKKSRGTQLLKSPSTAQLLLIGGVAGSILAAARVPR
jgi:hypothetical protein